MQTLRCKNCGKVLLEAEGQAHISKICPKCKTRNEFYINKDEKFQDKIIKKWGILMNYYIGTKLIKAEPCTVAEFNATEHPLIYTGKCKEGYKVIYPDNYVSWSPKDVFEKAYMKVDTNENLKSDISISQKMVDDFIKGTHVDTIGEKTTLVRATLRNGFELVEASSCVDKTNYDEKIGAEICMKKIKDKIWFLLGFLLQTAKNGIE